MPYERMKTPNQTSGYYAVRKGLKGIRSCLFLSWEDCRAFVDESAASEYQVFARVEEAVAYLRARPAEAMDGLVAPLPPPVADDSAAATKEPTRSPPRAAATASSTTEASPTPISKEDAQLLASACAAVVGEPPKRKTRLLASACAAVVSEQQKRKTPVRGSDKTNKRRGKALPSSTSPGKRRRLASDSAAAAAPAAKKTSSGTDQQEAQKTRMRRPTQKWESNFAKLEKLYEEKEDETEDEQLQRWIEKQREQYRLLQQGKPSSMYAEKVERMRSIGFEFDVQKKKATPKKKIGGIYKKWQENYDSLKEYSEAHDGSCDISKKDKEKQKLREWVQDQKQEYKKLMDEKETRMTQEKLELLKEIGCEFEYVPWNERLEQLKAYKQEHGDFSIPRRHEVLGKWVESLRGTIQRYEEGKSTREITKERMAQLKEIGFDLSGMAEKNNAQADEQDNAAWEEKFAMLQEFKRQHGDCKVKRTGQDVQLHSWVLMQRRAYLNLQEGKPSKLTALRLMRLNEIGFQFQQKGRYSKWSDRYEKLKLYKQQHGHANVPSANEELGEFVTRQRSDYRKRQDGLSSPMTDERLRLLQELDFNFEVVPKKDKDKAKPRSAPKTWDERFQDLLEFQEAFGHTVVPQHSQWTPGLGSWVKSQRSQYKHMLQGKKTSMTPEKALRLTNIGFKYEVLDSNRRRIAAQNDGHDESDEE